MIAWIIRKLRERRERKRKAEEAREWRLLCHRAARHSRSDEAEGETFHFDRGDVD